MERSKTLGKVGVGKHFGVPRSIVRVVSKFGIQILPVTYVRCERQV